MALRFWTIRRLVVSQLPVTDTCMGVRIKRAPRLIIIIIHKLKALLLNKFLLNLARRYLSFVRYYGGESVLAASHYGTWASLIGCFIDSQKPYACRCSA